MTFNSPEFESATSRSGDRAGRAFDISIATTEAAWGRGETAIPAGRVTAGNG
jgi:hypothetical protein